MAVGYCALSSMATRSGRVIELPTVVSPLVLNISWWWCVITVCITLYSTHRSNVKARNKGRYIADIPAHFSERLTTFIIAAFPAGLSGTHLHQRLAALRDCWEIFLYTLCLPLYEEKKLNNVGSLYRRSIREARRVCVELKTIQQYEVALDNFK